MDIKTALWGTSWRIMRLHNHLCGLDWGNWPKVLQPSSWIILKKSTQGFTTIFVDQLGVISLRFHSHLCGLAWGKLTQGFTTIFMDQLREMDLRFNNHLCGSAWGNRPKVSQSSLWISSGVSTQGFTISIKYCLENQSKVSLFYIGQENWPRILSIMIQLGRIDPSCRM